MVHTIEKLRERSIIRLGSDQDTVKDPVSEKKQQARELSGEGSHSYTRLATRAIVSFSYQFNTP